MDIKFTTMFKPQTLLNTNTQRALVQVHYALDMFI